MCIVTRGIWNPLSEGDGETLRRFIHTLRYFDEYVVGGTFEPLVAVATDVEGVYCSRFGGILYTCINRLATALKDIQLHLSPAPQGHTYWDVWYGAPLQVSKDNCKLILKFLHIRKADLNYLFADTSGYCQDVDDGAAWFRGHCSNE